VTGAAEGRRQPREEAGRKGSEGVAEGCSRLCCTAAAAAAAAAAEGEGAAELAGAAAAAAAAWEELGEEEGSPTPTYMSGSGARHGERRGVGGEDGGPAWGWLSAWRDIDLQELSHPWKRGRVPLSCWLHRSCSSSLSGTLLQRGGC
jgi:hypothetical protein